MPNSNRSRNLFKDERSIYYSLVFAGQGYYKTRDVLKAYQVACGYPIVELKQSSYNFSRGKLFGKTLDEVRIHVVDGLPLGFNSCK